MLKDELRGHELLLLLWVRLLLLYVLLGRLELLLLVQILLCGVHTGLLG